MKILLTGGGTAGSVSPLLAIAQQLRKDKPEIKLLWLGTKAGLEKKMVSEYDIELESIAAGKLRRYFNLRNFIDIFKIGFGFIQSFFIILKFRPDIILSAGSFVSVPVVWAGWVLGKKSLIHQQDVRPGLANRLMVPLATKITVTFEESLKHFPKEKTVWTGNPVREEILRGSKEREGKRFGLEPGVPVLLVMGGGTGSETINKVVSGALEGLVKFCQVIHLTGGKIPHNSSLMTNDFSGYHPIEFLDARGMADAYACADVVVSRCGLSSLTELSALSKPTIFIPLADTHQEDNAKLILRKKAGVVIWQKELTIDKFVKVAKNIIEVGGDDFSKNIRTLILDGREKMARVIEETANDDA